MADSMRASFAYKENNDMTDEIKNALAHLDLDKTGRVSTSELVAAAKALEEVRAKNSFMHRVLVVHAVTMLLLLGGMFGLSMTAAELSKETRVSNGGSLVTAQGEPVTVSSSDLYVGPNGQLLQRVSLEHSDGPQSIKTDASLPVLDLSEEGDDAGRALASNGKLRWRQVDKVLNFGTDMFRVKDGGSSISANVEGTNRDDAQGKLFAIGNFGAGGRYVVNCAWKAGSSPSPGAKICTLRTGGDANSLCFKSHNCGLLAGTGGDGGGGA